MYVAINVYGDFTQSVVTTMLSSSSKLGPWLWLGSQCECHG